MPIRTELMHAGVAAEASKAVCGFGSAALTLAGNSQATAFPLPNSLNLLGTVAASTGGILRADLTPGESQKVCNLTTTTATIYPPVGGTINGGSTNAGVSLPGNKTAEFICVLAGLNFVYNISA